MLKEIYNYVFNKSTLLLTRKQLGSMEISGIEEDTEDYRAMVLDLSNAYNSICKLQEILVEEQKDFQAYNCQDMNQVIFSRGTINGFELIREFIDKNRILPDVKSEYQD